MFKEIPSYLRQCGSLAYRGAWNMANGLVGAALGGLFMFYSGVIEFFQPITPEKVAMNWLISFVLYAIAAWFFIFLMRFLFVSPFKLYQKLLAEKKKLQSELDAIKLKDRQGYDPDMPLAEAIDYIQRKKEWREADDAIREIGQLAIDKKIRVWGVKETSLSEMFDYSAKEEIPPEYFAHFDRRGTEIKGFYLEFLYQGRALRYYQPTVSSEQIREFFQ